MKSKLFLLAGVIMVLSGALCAQETDTTASAGRVSYFGYIGIAAMFSEHNKPYTAGIHTIHGVKLGRFKMGAGLGLDSYDEWRVCTVFGSGTFDFARIRDNAFFIQANYGYADGVRLRDIEGSDDLNTQGGPFTNVLIGYRVDVSKKTSVIVAAGWRSQILSYSYSYAWASQTKYDITETLNRVELRLGFGFR